MYTYRICKYDPQYRGKDGAYLRDEWTDYSDIGSLFQGKVLAESEYLLVEQNYISCISAIMQNSKVETLRIRELEKRESKTWKNGQSVSDHSLARLISDCLRSKCWCKLIGNHAYVHFGYDFYVYVGCQLPLEHVESICENHNLFCNAQESPYND